MRFCKPLESQSKRSDWMPFPFTKTDTLIKQKSAILLSRFLMNSN
jgi:hypothetical protein